METLSAPTILVVDDNSSNLQVIGAVLEQAGYAVAFAFDGPEAIDYARTSAPDLILLDVMMPGMDGYEVMALLKQEPGTRNIPVIFLTALVGSEETVRGFEAGAADYVAKPFDYRELLARVSAQVELGLSRRRVEEYARQVAAMNDKLVEAMGKLEELATTDPLTKLPNRRYTLDRIGYEADRAKRSGKPFCLGILDIDFFKKVNDRFGHAAGDLVLSSFGLLVRASLRAQDLAGRWGGEEFAIVLPETELAGAGVLAERFLGDLRSRPMDISVADKPASVGVTATIGLAQFTPPDDDIDSLMRRADGAMYEGKRSGRNRVVLSNSGLDGAKADETRRGG
ncbi:MAG TPA: diguanylate cyclase [Rectinemataceae bacterium]|nr:diguanylate cyclase [Rectinemataceae bacterium]